MGFRLVPISMTLNNIERSYRAIRKTRYTGWGRRKYRNAKIAISQKCLNVFAPNFAHLFGTIPCTNVLLLCCICLTYVKLTETQTSRTNFTTEQKVDFILPEQQVPPLLWRHYFYVYVQHSIVIGPNSSIFQVIIAVRLTTLVMGKYRIGR